MAFHYFRRISRLDPMRDEVIEGITSQVDPHKTGEYNAKNWRMVADFMLPDGEENDYGVLSVPADRIGVLNSYRLISPHILHEYTDELKYGDMTYNNGHYCFTTEEYDEPRGITHTVKYGCPTQLEGEIPPSVWHIYVDCVSSTGITIQYRYSESGNTFIAIPQSLLLVNGNGTAVAYDSGEIGYEKQKVNLVLANPDNATGTKILELQNNALMHTLSTVVPNSYGAAADEVDFGKAFKSPFIAVNSTGHLISGTKEVPITIPATNATSTKSGLIKFGLLASIKQLGSANAAGTENSITARADHTHLVRSVTFEDSRIFTYSPSSLTNANIGSTELLLAMQGNEEIETVAGYKGSLEYDDNGVPNITYEPMTLNPIVAEQVSGTKHTLVGIGMGSMSDVDGTYAALGLTVHTTLLATKTSNYITAFDINEDGDDWIFSITRGGPDINALSLKSTITDAGQSNYIIFGAPYPFGYENEARILCGDYYHSFKVETGWAGMRYFMDNDTITDLVEGNILTAPNIEYDTSYNANLNLAWKPLDVQIPYMLDNNETVATKVSMDLSKADAKISLPFNDSPSSIHKMTVESGKYNGKFTEPIEIHVGLGVAVIPGTTVFPYNVPMVLVAKMSDDDGHSVEIQLSRFTVSLDYNLVKPTSAVEYAYQDFELKSLLHNYAYEWSSIELFFRHDTAYDAMTVTEYGTAGCTGIQLVTRYTHLSINGIK